MRLWTNQLTKPCDQRLKGTQPNPMLLLGAMARFSRRLYNITIQMRTDCIYKYSTTNNEQVFGLFARHCSQCWEYSSEQNR